MEPTEITRWMLWPDAGGLAILILVVDDSNDDELTGIFAREDVVPSEHFGGVWGSGQRDGCWLVSFQLVELGGGVERQWFTDNIHRPLLEAILEVPHLVAIVPEELAGDASTAEDIAPRLGGALILQVDSASPQVGEILAEREGD
jgi:hypothetical protein